MENRNKKLMKTSKYSKEKIIINVIMSIILVVIVAYLGHMIGGPLGKLIFNLSH